MLSTYIITSPHALCSNEINKLNKHPCDIIAGLSAKIFCKMVKKHTNAKCYYVKGNELRINNDLNRIKSRHTEFRKSLREILHVISQKNIIDSIVIDIHSFPNYWIKEAKDINFFKEHEIAPDVVILSGSFDKINNSSISNFLYQSLIANNINCKILNNIKVNDILNESSENKIPGILLEFNEKYINDIDTLTYICEIIINKLNNMHRI
jgi:hypothetical protein